MCRGRRKVDTAVFMKDLKSILLPPRVEVRRRSFLYPEARQIMKYVVLVQRSSFHERTHGALFRPLAAQFAGGQVAKKAESAGDIHWGLLFIIGVEKLSLSH